MRNILFLLIAVSSIYAQEQKTVLVSQEKYKEQRKTADSLGFRVIHGDTLVIAQNFDLKIPNGIRVPFEYRDSTFIEYYKKVAFYHTTNIINPNTTMKYWKEPINIYITDKYSKKVKKDFNAFTKDISNQIDSLHIKIVKDINKANFVIYTNDDFNYDPNLSITGRSTNYSYWNNKNQLYKCFIKINQKNLFNDDLQLYELKVNFIQMLGYFKPQDDFECKSYFSTCYSSNKQITELDLSLLKYHYSYGYCKGVTLESFEQQQASAWRAKKKNPKNKFTIIHPEY